VIQRHSKVIPKGLLHISLVYLELMMIPLNANIVQILTTIKGKDYMLYSLLIKGDTRKKNPKKYLISNYEMLPS